MIFSSNTRMIKSLILLLLPAAVFEKAFALSFPKTSIVNHSKASKKDGTTSGSNKGADTGVSTNIGTSIGTGAEAKINPFVSHHHHHQQHQQSHHSGASSSVLKYSNLSEEEGHTGGANKNENDKKVDDWFGKWFEKNLQKSFLDWKEHLHGKDFESVDGKGGKQTSQKSTLGARKEIDEEMPGSTITYLRQTDDLTKDIQILPSNAPMVNLMPLEESDSQSQDEHNNKHKHAQSHKEDRLNDKSNDKPSIRERIEKRQQRRKQRKEQNLKDEYDIFPIFGGSQHIERMNVDIRHLSLAIAGNIDNQEQWKEFFEDSQGEGLNNILQCIRDVAKEIKLGYATDVYDDNDDISMLDQATRRENAFVAACSAVKVLRGLCSIDQNWSAYITDEILCTNQNELDAADFEESDNSFLGDLAVMLKYANEGEMLYNRRIFKKRRELRAHGISIKRFGTRRQRREARSRSILYINQFLLGMALASDDAIQTFRSTPGLLDSILLSSSYTSQQKLKGRWLRYPVEKVKRIKDSILRRKVQYSKRAFLEAAKLESGLKGKIQATSNKLLAAMGHNIFVPKVPGQRGLRILSLDGGGTRGIATIAIIRALVDEMGVEVCDLFDIICGTSTGAIIAFLVGLKLESSELAKNRYDELIEKIFVKSSLSTPMLLFTTAAYSEVPFKMIMEEILGDYSMLDSREDPRVPYVFAVSSKMSSTTSKLSLFRNYNYVGGEKADKFIVNPDEARRKLGFKPRDKYQYNFASNKNYVSTAGSRHDGSFRVLQRAALRATTAAPTVFKPVVMGGEIYSDGGIVASNPTAVAIHEARTLFPDIPIELCVSCGTGEFVSERVSPSFGWDGIVSQIVKSATDTAKTHWVLEDILGQGNTCNGASGVSDTKYFRFDPIIGTPAEFPIDGTDAKRLHELSEITTNYMKDEKQAKKLKEIKSILGAKRYPFSG